MRPWLITSTAPIRRSPSILIAAESFASGSTLCDLMAFGIENCTYRHCRLPEADRAQTRARPLFRESSINSSAPVSLQAWRTSTAVKHASAGFVLRHSNPAMMDEIAPRRKRRSAAIRSSADDASAASRGGARNRIEQRKQQQAGEKSADMRLPGDARAVGADRDRSDAEDDVDAEPDREKTEHARIAQRSASATAPAPSPPHRRRRG